MHHEVQGVGRKAVELDPVELGVPYAHAAQHGVGGRDAQALAGVEPTPQEVRVLDFTARREAGYLPPVPWSGHRRSAISVRVASERVVLERRDYDRRRGGSEEPESTMAR